MFEVGFTEILVISVLALVVLGPEKLPRVAAQIGRWVGRARAMARQFREQLEEEVQINETNKTKAKESARAEADVSAAQSAAAPAAAAASTTPGADAPYGDNTQHVYSGVTGEDPHSSAMATALPTQRQLRLPKPQPRTPPRKRHIQTMPVPRRSRKPPNISLPRMPTLALTARRRRKRRAPSRAPRSLPL